MLVIPSLHSDGVTFTSRKRVKLIHFQKYQEPTGGRFISTRDSALFIISWDYWYDPCHSCYIIVLLIQHQQNSNKLFCNSLLEAMKKQVCPWKKSLHWSASAIADYLRKRAQFHAEDTCWNVLQLYSQSHIPTYRLRILYMIIVKLTLFKLSSLKYRCLTHIGYT